MSEKKRIDFYMVLGIILSVSLIISGVCLMVGCYKIYTSGAEQLYTREAVASVFKTIRIPIFASLLLIAVSFIAYLFSSDNGKCIARPDTAQIHKMLCGNRDLDADKGLSDELAKTNKNRKILNIIKLIINIVCSVIFLIYALDPSNFDRLDINSSMIAAMTVLLPCLAVSLSSSFIIYLLKQRSLKAEINLLKKFPLKQADNEGIIKEAYEQKEKKLRIIKLALLVIFIGVAIFGFISGGTADVLTKAINICTECIGLG